MQPDRLVHTGPKEASLFLTNNGLLRLPQHDIHPKGFLLSLQVYVSDDLESHFPIDNGIDVVRALQVACSSFTISLDVTGVSGEVGARSVYAYETLTLSVMCSTSFLAYPLPRLAVLVPR
jgi:hypothetical protein